MGGEYRALQDKEGSAGNQSGSFYFSRMNTGLLGHFSGNAIASLLLGYVAGESIGIQPLQYHYIRQKYLAVYGSDTWKITPKLTLNYGSRWDLSTPTKNKYDAVSYIDPLIANPEVGSLPGLEVAQLIEVANWLKQPSLASKVRLESTGIRNQVAAEIAAALEPNLFSDVVIREGMLSLGFLLEAPVPFSDAPELFCLGLYKDFDLNRFIAMVAPTRVTTEKLVELPKKTEAADSGGQ